MQKFNSKSVQSFADLNRRSKSLSKITDQSSILHTCNDLGASAFRAKLSESNVGNAVQSKKTLALKTSRPNTANTNYFSPQKGSLAVSRSESPFCVGSLSPSRKSTLANSPTKSHKVPDSTVYEAIKSQNMQFFKKSFSEIPYFIPLKDVLARQTAAPDSSIQISTMREMNTTSRNTRLSTEGSPRKKLVAQPRKIYNVKAMRLKETLLSSLNAPIKAFERRGSREPGSYTSRKSKKDDKLAVKEENPAAQLAALKKLEEERKFIDSIGKVSYERFYMNIDLYNKYYAAYLHEPEVHYTGLEDLKVSLRPREDVQTRAQSQDKEKEKKRMSIKNKDGQVVKHYGSFKPTTHVIENRLSQVTRASMLKFPGERMFKRDNMSARKAVEWADIGKGDGEESGTEQTEWMLFGKEMAGVQHNLKNLQKINSLITNGNNELNEEEQQFLRAVKEGKEAEVEKMLRMNSELVKIRDIGNKTPLHWAMKRHYVGIVGELYSHGADLEEVDMTGRKPLDLVKGPHRKEIIGVLEQKHWRLRRKTATFG